MNNDNDLSIKASRRQYRDWSEKKAQILIEAEQTSVYATALKYDLKPSQVFDWRKKQRADQLTLECLSV